MLPISLEAATLRMMDRDSIAREPEMFGDVFVDHFGGTREHEVKLWNEAVTNWEGMLFLYPVGKQLKIPQWNDISSWRNVNK